MTEPIDPNELISEYIELRDYKKAEEEKFEAFMENVDDRMKQIEFQLLGFLNDTNGDRWGSDDTGSCHRITKTSVSVADPALFKRHVIGTENWDLINWAANKTEINKLAAKHVDVSEIGVNRSEWHTIGVTRKKPKRT